ncbi:MAG: FprA family A-type flavoprotein [Bacteroidales bacterium]|nr:FprA family A-type flavoprotein [Bacteroidales bacterium]
MSEILKINDTVSWIGILDDAIVTFDIVMETQHGTTYNSYFIDADVKAVIDTAKASFKEEYLGNICQVTDPELIEVIVVNHTEPDHSGNVASLLEIAPKAKVYGSRQALNYLSEMLNKPFDSVVVKDGDTLSLGNKTLRFIGAPNLHWPDSIYTYLEEDGLLFTCDSFGAHFSDPKMFNDLTGDYREAFDYYFHVILEPFSKFMLKAIEKIENLEIKALCPGHGPIIRKDIREVIAKTKKASEKYLQTTECEGNEILITYVSAYGYTREMAEYIASGIRERASCKVHLTDIEDILSGDLEELLVKCNALLIGSPTINQNTVLPVYKLFALINPIRDKGKKAAVFGSYGWSGEAVKLIEEQLKLLKLNVILDGMSARFAPSRDQAAALVEYGRTFADRLKGE